MLFTRDLETIGPDAFDKCSRRESIDGNMCRIDHDHATRSGKPNATVSRFATSSFNFGGVDRFHVLQSVVSGAFDPRNFSAGKFVHSLLAHAKDPTAGLRPQIAE